MSANRYAYTFTYPLDFFQVNATPIRLNPETVEEIFERSLSPGNFKLEFEEFEKSVIMVALLFYPTSHAACAYTSFIEHVLMHLPSLRTAHFPTANLEKTAALADALMEKHNACGFAPAHASTAAQDAPACPSCTDSKEIPPIPLSPRSERSPRRHRRGLSASPTKSDIPAVVSPKLGHAVNIQASPVLLESRPLPPSEASCSITPKHGVRSPSTSPFGSPSRIMQPDSPDHVGSPIRAALGRPASSPSRRPHPERPNHVGFPARRTPTKQPHEFNQVSLSPSRRSTGFLKPETELARAEEIHDFAIRFEKYLISNFKTLELAFDYFDCSTGARTGKVSMTKFTYGCSSIGFNGDVKALFYYLDTQGDGTLDLEELRMWRAVREKHLASVRRISANPAFSR